MSIQVKDANNATQTIATLDDLLSIVATAANQSTGNTTLHADLAAVLAKLSADPATQTTLTAILAKLTADPATQTTLAAVLTALGVNHTDDQQLHTDIATTLHGDLAAVLAKLSADPATQTTLTAILAKLTTDPATQTTLTAVLAAAVAATPAGENHVGEVGGNTAVAGASFTRPANTTAYVSGQLVANNTVGASVTPIPCPVARKNAGTGVLTGVRLSKSSASLTNAAFRVHLFKTAPTTTAGDGATFAGAVTGVASVALGYVDITMDQAYSDGAKGFVALQAKAFDAAVGSQNIYALIEARGAYTPANGETFTLALEALRD